MDKQIVLTLLTILMVSPIYINAGLLTQMLNIPTVSTVRTTRSVDILGTMANFEEEMVTTSWPNGTKYIEVKWNCSRLSNDIKNLRFNASFYVDDYHPMDSMIAYGIEMPPIPKPVRPPSVSAPPISSFTDEGMWFLREGTYHPPNETEEIMIKYDQVDNWWSYHARDWYDGWAYTGSSNRTIEWHIEEQLVQSMVRGETSHDMFWQDAFIGAAAGLGLTAAACSYFAAQAAEGTIASCWCPPVAIACAIAVFVAAVAAIYYSQHGFDIQQYFDTVVATAKGDGFGELSVCGAVDKWAVYEDYWNRPGCERWHYSERTFSVSLGADRGRNSIAEWTSWELLYDVMPAEYDSQGNPLTIPDYHINWR